MTRIATTWGITGPELLWFYGALCAVLSAAIWRVRRSLLGARQRSKDPTPDIGLYKMALLNGGPQLAITTAATTLHQEGVLAQGSEPRTHVVAGTLDRQADRLERAVFDSVRAEPGISTELLRLELAGSDPIQVLERELREAGLLLEDDAARRLRRLWVWGALVALIGVAAIVAGLGGDATVIYLAIMVAGAVAATGWLIRNPTTMTARGREIVRARREDRKELRRVPVAAESATAVALFGGGALWLADPGLASTLDVPREDAALWQRRDYACSAGGSCGGGVTFGGGCGGGGGHGGGHGGGCGGGGGGCGGGGCGGG
jgi:uncharacterized protein (TIGR04222 family)